MQSYLFTRKVIKTSRNQRLIEWVRLVALYQTANTSGSQIVTKEMKALSPLLSPKWKHGAEVRVTYCFDWELLWKDLTTVNKFSADDKCPRICADNVFQVSGTASAQSSYYHLVSQHKSSKTCNKGPETKFPEIFDYLFTRANSHDKFSMTNDTDMLV